MNKPTERQNTNRDTGKTPATPTVWTSAELLQGNVEAVIQHEEEVYRLRLTRQGKLILYK